MADTRASSDPHSDTSQVSTFPSILVTRQCHGLSHYSPAPAVPAHVLEPFPIPHRAAVILWEIGTGRTLCTTTLGTFGWEQFHRTFFKHSLRASPATLMNSLCIRLCLSCQTGLSNETPKVLAHASREDHWPNSYSFEILSVANFHWGKILMHCESHRNLIKLESANGWLEDHTAVGTRHNPSSTDQPQLSETEECCLPEVRVTLHPRTAAQAKVR